MSLRVAFVVWIVTFLLATACAEVPPLRLSPSCEGREGLRTVDDSAGVRTVHNTCPAAIFAWVVGDSALLEIGEVNGDPAEEFGAAAFMTAVRLIDGRFVVLDRSSGEVRYFLPTGEHDRSAGRIGDGPGEFRFPYPPIFPLAGDGVAVQDVELRRLTTFDAEGDLASVASIRLPEGPERLASLRVLGRGMDGSILLHVDVGSSPLLYRDGRAHPRVASVWRTNSLGTAATKVVDVPGDLEVLIPEYGAPALVPLSEAAFVDSWAGGIVIGDRMTFTFERYDPEGNLELVLTRDIVPRPVQRDDLEDMRDAAIERQRRRYEDHLIVATERLIERPEVPQTFPTFDPVLVDRVGNLWVGVNEPEPGLSFIWRRTGLSRIWSVFDRDGIWVTDVQMPEGLRVTDIGEDYVLGIARGELDIPVVRYYALTKTGMR